MIRQMGVIALGAGVALVADAGRPAAGTSWFDALLPWAVTTFLVGFFVAAGAFQWGARHERKARLALDKEQALRDAAKLRPPYFEPNPAGEHPVWDKTAPPMSAPAKEWAKRRLADELVRFTPCPAGGDCRNTACVRQHPPGGSWGIPDGCDPEDSCPGPVECRTHGEVPPVTCGATDDAGDHVYGTCNRPPHADPGHVEMRDGKVWANWGGATHGMRPDAEARFWFNTDYTRPLPAPPVPPAFQGIPPAAPPCTFDPCRDGACQDHYPDGPAGTYTGNQAARTVLGRQIVVGMEVALDINWASIDRLEHLVYVNRWHTVHDEENAEHYREGSPDRTFVVRDPR